MVRVQEWTNYEPDDERKQALFSSDNWKGFVQLNAAVFTQKVLQPMFHHRATSIEEWHWHNAHTDEELTTDLFLHQVAFVSRMKGEQW